MHLYLRKTNCSSIHPSRIIWPWLGGLHEKQHRHLHLVKLLEALHISAVPQAGELSLEVCNVTSKTGTGVASEGGLLSMENSRIHDCKGQGVAVYADLEGASGKAIIHRCQISNNLLNGILIKEGTLLILSQSEIAGNKGHGLVVKVSSDVLPTLGLDGCCQDLCLSCGLTSRAFNVAWKLTCLYLPLPGRMVW